MDPEGGGGRDSVLPSRTGRRGAREGARAGLRSQAQDRCPRGRGEGRRRQGEGRQHHPSALSGAQVSVVSEPVGPALCLPASPDLPLQTGPTTTDRTYHYRKEEKP